MYGHAAGGKGWPLARLRMCSGAAAMVPGLAEAIARILLSSRGHVVAACAGKAFGYRTAIFS